MERMHVKFHMFHMLSILWYAVLHGDVGMCTYMNDVAIVWNKGYGECDHIFRFCSRFAAVSTQRAHNGRSRDLCKCESAGAGTHYFLLMFAISIYLSDFVLFSRLPSAESNDIKTCRTRPSFYFSSVFHFYCHWGMEEGEGEIGRWRKAYVIYHVLIVNLFICTLPAFNPFCICISFVFPHEFRQQDNDSFKYFGAHCAPFGGKSHWKWNWKVSCHMLPYFR